MSPAGGLSTFSGARAPALAGQEDPRRSPPPPRAGPLPLQRRAAPHLLCAPASHLPSRALRQRSGSPWALPCGAVHVGGAPVASALCLLREGGSRGWALAVRSLRAEGMHFPAGERPRGGARPVRSRPGTAVSPRHVPAKQHSPAAGRCFLFLSAFFPLITVRGTESSVRMSCGLLGFAGN